MHYTKTFWTSHFSSIAPSCVVSTSVDMVFSGSIASTQLKVSAHSYNTSNILSISSILEIQTCLHSPLIVLTCHRKDIHSPSCSSVVQFSLFLDNVKTSFMRSDLLQSFHEGTNGSCR